MVLPKIYNTYYLASVATIGGMLYVVTFHHSRPTAVWRL